MTLATDAHGNELIELELEETPVENSLAVPLTGALVVATGAGGVLFIHDVWRDHWEVPGGGIEVGESSEQAATCEVVEESGQRLTNLRPVGRATFRLIADGSVEQAALFRGEVHEVAPFDGNEGTDAISRWHGESALQALDAIDAELIRRVLRAERS